ncbi:MAG TPA: 3-deoxy-D-manno-octulosonic acid transferase [Candidatus Acidoferrales bacterium]|nr:3-deoxy-D-manno-octulosonic acid transferase [Candidatus Acidoferrales bacterium]
MYFFYRLITAVGMIFLAPYYALRGWHRDEPSSAGERLGNVPPEILSRARMSHRADSSAAGSIWIHAVSVGEVLAAKPLADGLQKRFPGRPIFVSTTTETGQRLARERLHSVDGIFYFPLDWLVPVRRALNSIHPSLVIVMETEIWPNFLREARRMNVPVIFANARVSEKSFGRFKRWEFLVGPFFKRTLQDAELFLAQAPDDAARLREMGAPEERVEVTGNLKYDADPPAPSAFTEWLAQQIRAQERWPVFVAGSVVAEEEQAVVAAYDIVQRKWRHALLILAPRKPDRFEAAAAIAAEGGWNVVRRSRLDLAATLDENADVLVLDSIGELAGLYSLADAAFVGGSLVPAGGHNILEPAWFSKPPVFGGSMENFREMAAEFLAAKGGIEVSSGPMLGKVWEQLVEDKSTREKMGAAARALSERNRGATARSLDRIAAVLGSHEGRKSEQPA